MGLRDAKTLLGYADPANGAALAVHEQAQPPSMAISVLLGPIQGMPLSVFLPLREERKRLQLGNLEMQAWAASKGTTMEALDAAELELERRLRSSSPAAITLRLQVAAASPKPG